MTMVVVVSAVYTVDPAIPSVTANYSVGDDPQEQA